MYIDANTPMRSFRFKCLNFLPTFNVNMILCQLIQNGTTSKLFSRNCYAEKLHKAKMSESCINVPECDYSLLLFL